MKRKIVKEHLANTFSIIRLVINQAKKLWCINFILEIFHGCSFVLTIILTQKLFDSLIDAINNQQVGMALLFVGLVFLSGVTSQLLNGGTNFLGNYISNIVIGKLNVIVQKKANNIDPINYEMPDYLNDINKTEEGIRSACELTLTFLALFSFYIPYFLFMSFYLFYQEPLLIISILFVFVPVLIGQIFKIKYSYALVDKTASFRRSAEEFEKTLTNVNYVKETKILGVSSFFRAKLAKSIEAINELSYSNSKKNLCLTLIMNGISLLGYIGLLIMLFVSVVNKRISIGAFAAIFSSIDVMFIVMNEIIEAGIGKMSEMSGSIVHLVRYLNLPEKDGQVYKNTNDSINLTNVSFSYPLTEKDTLKSINLTIQKGEKIALVGENGSGKTTLTKLITGLYEPSLGDIEVNGINTKKAKSYVIYDRFSIVFQKFNRYKLSLKDNVILSDIKSTSAFQDALDKADFKMDENKLVNGEQTILSREFGGIDLSGGQWQRLALSRAYYRDRDILVLDEPTSAIDPIEEAQLYSQFFALSEEKTSIIVTHRLGSAHLADRVILMSNGEIIEDGTHEELIASKKTYWKLWNAQAKWYN